VINRLVPRWASVRIRADKWDLKYLREVLLSVRAPIRSARSTGPGLVVTWARYKYRLLYRCEIHDDCKRSFELGRACHLDPASIAAWKLDQETDKVVMGVSVVRLGRPVAVEPNVLFSYAETPPVGYILSGVDS
jgi:hypothetical protein